MKRFLAVLFALGVAFTALPSCEQWVAEGTAETVQEAKKNVSMSPVTAGDYGGSLPLVSISCPDAGEPIKAEDIRAPVAALLAECDDIRNNAVTGLANKVDRTGDTMTGTLTITPTTPGTAFVVNAEAASKGAQFNGSNTEPALEINGGTTTNAAQIVCSSDTYAVEIENNGGGGGLNLQADPSAATDPVLEVFGLTPSSATVPRVAAAFNGALHLTTPNPNAGIDPGADGMVFPGSVARARGRVFLGGAPPYSFIGKPLNFVALVAIVGLGTTRVTMVRPMADVNYEVQLTVNGATGYGVAETNIAGRTTTQFEFTVFSTTTGTLGVVAAEYVDVAVFGEQ